MSTSLVALGEKTGNKGSAHLNHLKRNMKN